MQEASDKQWQSIAVWPDSIQVGGETGKDETRYQHHTKETAVSFCQMLKWGVFDGEKRIFPLSTRVERLSEQ